MSSPVGPAVASLRVTVAFRPDGLLYMLLTKGVASVSISSDKLTNKLFLVSRHDDRNIAIHESRTAIAERHIHS